MVLDAEIVPAKPKERSNFLVMLMNAEIMTLFSSHVSQYFHWPRLFYLEEAMATLWSYKNTKPWKLKLTSGYRHCLLVLVPYSYSWQHQRIGIAVKWKYNCDKKLPLTSVTVVSTHLIIWPTTYSKYCLKQNTKKKLDELTGTNWHDTNRLIKIDTFSSTKSPMYAAGIR